MKEIPYESGPYYIFERAYNTFRMRYNIHWIGAYLLIRAKINLQYRTIKWKRRLPRNVLSDLTIGSTGLYPKQYYPGALRLVRIPFQLVTFPLVRKSRQVPVSCHGLWSPYPLFY